MIKFCCLVLAILFGIFASAQINVVPMPAAVKLTKGFSVIQEPIGLITVNYEEGNVDAGIDNFKQWLRIKHNIKKIIEGDTHSYGLPTEFFFGTPGLKTSDEYYKIEIKQNKINIYGISKGTFYALETLKQLITKNKKGELVLPNCIIEDEPRFSYRGMHLDVSRHFFSVSEVKRYIDHLAAYKFNTFHWHLTDDQGWRIEIKKYPLLTKIGGCRAQTLVGPYGTNKYDGTKYCGFYTQKQIKDVVAYAKRKHINIIPEIEMPGHALAALTAYPFLGCTKGPYKTMETWGVSDDPICAGNDSSYIFLQNVLDEVMSLFPSKYIHIGGDECPKQRWAECPFCKKRMKDEQLQNEKELQSYFIKKISAYLQTKGRKIIGWNEIMEGGLAPGATVMSWQGEEAGILAAKASHDVIMAPETYCYLDRSQSRNEDSLTFGGYMPLEKVYAYDPVPSQLPDAYKKYIIGAQGNLWTEYISNEKKIEYMLFPRLAALAEVLWTPKEKRSWESFEKRMPAIFQYYRDNNINFSNAYYDLDPRVISLPGDKIGWQLETKNKAAHIIYRKKDAAETITYNGPVVISESGTSEAAIADTKNNILSNFAKQAFSLNKATGKKISLAEAPSPSYPGNGAFTLVDGVQNIMGMGRSAEFLGFSGKDLEATIDLGEPTNISEVKVHTFTQTASWIYPPAGISVMISDDGKHFTLAGNETSRAESGHGIHSIAVSASDQPLHTRFLKIAVKNYGIIPATQPGAGNPAWLFVDEIEVF